MLADAPMDLDADDGESDSPQSSDHESAAVDDATTLVLGAEGDADVAPLADVASEAEGDGGDDEGGDESDESDDESSPNEPSGSNGDRGVGAVAPADCLETPPVKRVLDMDAAVSQEKKKKVEVVEEIDSDYTSSSATVARCCKESV